MAAGLTVREENFGAFAAAFRAAARELLSDEQLRPRLHIDHEVTFSELNFELLHWHELLQPFGNGNRQPLFYARAVEPAAPPRLVKEKHILLQLRQKNYRQRAIFFDGARDPLPPPPWDVAFQIKAGEYEGEARIDLQVHAVRQAVPLQ